MSKIRKAYNYLRSSGKVTSLNLEAKMQDAIFIYKKGNSYRVLNLERSAHEGALKSEGWEHIETLSASVWVSTYLNVTDEDKAEMLAAIMHKEG